MKKHFILYDGRAKAGDEDDASIICTANSEKEARQDGKRLFDGLDHIWFEYEEHGNELRNGKPRFDLPPCK